MDFQFANITAQTYYYLRTNWVCPWILEISNNYISGVLSTFILLYFLICFCRSSPQFIFQFSSVFICSMNYTKCLIQWGIVSQMHIFEQTKSHSDCQFVWFESMNFSQLLLVHLLFLLCKIVVYSKFLFFHEFLRKAHSSFVSMFKS